MGNVFYASEQKPKNTLSKLKEQVKQLGDQFPYGDDEILRLARCHAYLLALNNENKTVPSSGGQTFLSDWAVYCSTLPPPSFTMPTDGSDIPPYRDILQLDLSLFAQNKNDDNDTNTTIDIEEQRKAKTFVMDIIETHILPTNFGNTLYDAVFALPKEQEQVDENIPMQRLEKFMSGSAECARRGSRKTLSVLFKCCCCSSSSSSSANMANARQLLELVYRLSIATSFLSNYHHYIVDQFKEQDTNFATMIQSITSDSVNYFPQEIGDELVDSLLDYSSKQMNQQNQMYSYSSTPFDNNRTTTSSNNDDGQDKSMVSLDTFLQWSEDTLPLMSSCLETFMHYLLFPDKAYPPSRTEFVFPNLKGRQSAFFSKITNVTMAKESEEEEEEGNNEDKEEENENNDGGNNADCYTHDDVLALSKMKRTNGQCSSPLLFSFAAMSPALGGAWHRIYTSDSDGLSFNRLQNSLLGYGGPTLLIIREASSKQGIFGAFSSTAWKESKDFYGNSDCFLFRLNPSMTVFRPRGGGGGSNTSSTAPNSSNGNKRGGTQNYMYCNSASRSKGYDGLAHGIGFGGTDEKPRLFIPESFDGCMAASGDLTFEAGALLPPRTSDDGGALISSKHFDLESLEVWGVGGDDVVSEALGARDKEREKVADNLRKARKVDKAAFLDDFKSGLIESKAFQHREQMRGRDDCQLDEEDEDNYSYTK